MAKAHITTKDGSTIQIEGTAEEVATLIARFDGRDTDGTQSKKGTTARSSGKSKGKKKSGGKAKTGPATLVADMIQSGTFKKPKGLSDIQTELKQGGHYYNNASVATALLRAVKHKELRRLKQDNNWVYVI